MNKRFVKWQLRQWLPPIIVFGVFLASVFLSSCMSSSVYARVATQDGMTYIMEYPETNLMSIFVPSLILTFVMPCFVYHFRYRRESADFYRQAPMEEAAIRRHKMLLGLGILLAVITAVFWLGFLILITRFYLAVDPGRVYGSIGGYGYASYNLYFGYYPLAWLFLILFVSAQYFINCFLVSLAGTLLDGILLMIVGQIFLNGLFEFPLILIYEGVALAADSYSEGLVRFGNVLTLFPGVGAVEPVLFGGRLFDPLIKKNEATIVSEDALYNFVTFASISLYFLIAGGLGFLSMKEKDPSGEYFGKSGPRKPIYALPIYLAGAATVFLLPVIASVGLLTNFVLLLFLSTMFFSLWGLGYFVILVIFHRSFNIGKKALTVYLITVSTCLLLVIAFSIYTYAMRDSMGYGSYAYGIFY